MAKKNRKQNPEPQAGSRRQAKLAQRAAERAALERNPRPFAGVWAETDLIALREFVPAASFPAEVDGQEVTVASVLPGAVAALVREDGTRLVGVQQAHSTGELDRDLAAALSWAVTANPGEVLESAAAVEPRAALAELLPAREERPEISVYQDFDWWVPAGVENAELARAVEAANGAMMPSDLIEAEGVVSAWWVDTGERAHVRWVREDDEDALFDALARVHAAGDLTVGEGSRFAGSFRAHGILVPVFDLDRELHPKEWAPGMKALQERVAAALADPNPLSDAERRSRNGLRARQVTLR